MKTSHVQLILYSSYRCRMACELYNGLKILLDYNWNIVVVHMIFFFSAFFLRSFAVAVECVYNKEYFVDLHVARECACVDGFVCYSQIKRVKQGNNGQI